jgi:hypothetical protein
MAQPLSVAVLPPEGESADTPLVVDPDNDFDDATLFSVWDEATSVHVRFPYLRGQALHDKLRDTYFLPCGPMTCDLLAPGSNEPLIVRAKDNDRDMDDTREEYLQYVLESGIMAGMRSEPIGIPLQDGLLPLTPQPNCRVSCRIELVAAATLVEAAYLARQRFPLNPQVIYSFKKGLQGVRLLDPRSPVDVRAYFKEAGNMFNCIGARSSFMELYNLVPIIEQERKEEMSAKRKGRSSAGKAAAGDDVPDDDGAGKGTKRTYAGRETEYHDFIKTHHPGKFEDWTDWDRAKVFLHRMQEMKFWKEYVSYANGHCKYRDTALSNKMVLSLNHQIVQIMKPYPELQRLIPFICRFAIPTNDEAPWLLTKSDDMKSVKLLFTKMVDSKLYKANSLSLLCCPEPETVVQLSKRAGSGKKMQKDRETFAEETVSNRPTMMLDDILNGIIFVLKDVKQDSHDIAQVELWLMRCLEFGMIGIAGLLGCQSEIATT